MKTIILFLAVCFFYLNSFAQNDSLRTPRFKLEYADSCVDPFYESNVWIPVKGKVIEIVNGNTIIIKGEDGRNKRLILAAVDISSGVEEYADSAKQLLTRLALNKEVSATVNPSDLHKDYPVMEEFICNVHTKSISLNRELIEYGYARYKTPEPYTLSLYTNCVYQILGRKAQRENIGLWSILNKRTGFNPPEWIRGYWQNRLESNLNNFQLIIFEKDNILFKKGFSVSTLFEEDSSTTNFSKKFFDYKINEIYDSTSYRVVMTCDNDMIEYEFKKIKLDYEDTPVLTYSIKENNEIVRPHSTYFFR